MLMDWNIKLLCGLLVLVTAENPPPNNVWNLKYSDPSRTGKRLSIPLHYGDWVPIDKARALVEDLARGFTGQTAVKKKDSVSHQLIQDEDILVAPLDVAEDRIDYGEPIYINTVPKNLYGYPLQRKPSSPVRFQGQPYNRFQYQKTNNRRYRKLPGPPTQKKTFQQNWYNGKSKQPVLNKKKFPVKPFNQPQSSVPLVNSVSKDKKRPTQSSLTTNQVNTYLESLNAIRTIQAPDLTKYGPPIIELGTGTDGEIVLGRPENQDHLAGFVSLDFDSFYPGDSDDKKSNGQKKERLSLLVAGNNNIHSNDESGLVNFLNSEGAEAKTFVIESGKTAPKGFSKINLPFMDPTNHKGNLPKAFIAPKGIPIPDGYKGKPLPPTPSDKQTSTESVLLIQVPNIEERNSDTDKYKPISLYNRRPTTSFLRPKLKLTEKPKVTAKTTTAPKRSNSLRYKLQKKNRPSLEEFYLKNKKKTDKFETKPDEPQKKEYYKKPFEKIYLKNKKFKETIKRTYPTTKVEGIITTNPTFIETTKENTFSTNKNYLHETELPILKTTVDFDDTDPLSIIYDPFYEPLSTFEQVEADNETTTNSQSIIYLTSTEVEPTIMTTISSTESTTPITIASTSSATTIEITVTSTSSTSTTTTEATSSTSSTSTTLTTTSTTTTSTIQTTSSVKDITTENENKDNPTTASADLSTQKETTQSPSSNAFIHNQSNVHRTTDDPLIKLDNLRRQKEKLVSQVYPDDLLTAEDIDEDNSSTTEAPEFNFIRPFRNRLRLKKFKGLTQNDASSPGKFGKRLRSRKRPTFWANRYGQGLSSVEPTPRSGPGPFRGKQRPFPVSSEDIANSNDKSIAKPEDFKRKFRPFSDQLFSSLTQDSENGFAANNRRFGFPRRRSTAAPPQITVDAEVYEVHPKTRLRVTTRKPYTQVTTEVSSTGPTEREASTDGDYYTYQDDYSYEPTTAQDTETGEEYTTTLYEEKSSKANPSSTISSNLEYVSTTQKSQGYDSTVGIIQLTTTKESTTDKSEEVTSTYVPTVTTSTTIDDVIDETTENYDVHETADKHTTHEQPQSESATKSNKKEIVSDLFEAIGFTNENIDLDATGFNKPNIILDISNEIVDQEFEESQQIETVVKPDEDTDSNGRLSMYEKNIDTTKYGDDKDYNKTHIKIVNEHGKPVVTEEDTKHHVNLTGYAGWQASVQPLKPYYKINRSEGKSPIVSIEEINITESKDYSQSDIIYDINKDSFDDEFENKNSFSIPVSVSLNVPETTTTNYEPTVAAVIDTTTTTEKAVTLSSTTTEEQSTTVEVVSSTDDHISTTSQTLTTEEPTKPVTSYSRIYSIINRNRQPSSVSDESSRDKFEEVFLGTTTRIIPTETKLKTTTTQIPTHATAEHNDDETTVEPYQSGAHKIPTKLWAAYKESQDESHLKKVDHSGLNNVEPVSDDITSLPSENHEEHNTESLNIATMMNYVDVSKESLIKSTANPQIIEYKELSEIIKPETETVITSNLSVNKRPKSFDLTAPTEQSVDKGNIQIHSFGVEQLIPLRKPDGKYKKKSETKTKKREEWIKNWVARKYNKPKFPRGSLSPLAPNKQVITTEEPEPQPSIQPENKNSLFTPTVAPKAPSIELVNDELDNFVKTKSVPFNVNIDSLVKDNSVQKVKTTPANNLKSSLLEKYSSTRHNLVKNSRFITNNNKSTDEARKNIVYNTGVPRGAKSNVFKNYAGDKLSQADFERQILGVSTATEISVSSMICVKGRCFNADDMGKLLSK